MALTVTFSGDWMEVLGNKRATKGVITFDSSYALGGESLTAANVGLGRLDDIQFNQGADNYLFEYDYANAKLKAKRSAPGFIVEEAVTVSSHTGTLKYPPAYIVAIEATAGSATPTCFAIPAGKTPATGQCAINFTTGVLTFNSTDAVTAARVTYFPQRVGTIFDPANMVVDEAIVAAAAKTTLANRALCVQYVYDATDGARCALEPVGEAPSATHNAVIDILNGSSATDIDFHSDDEGNSVLVTYIKFSALPSADMFINDTDITLSSQAYNFTQTAHYPFLVVPGYGTSLVGEETATNAEAAWGGPSETAANNVARWQPALNAILTAQTGTMTTTATPWFILPAELYMGGAALNEAAVGANLTGVTVEFRAVGI